MGTWNYRVLQWDHGFSIHEVHYSEDGDPTYYAADPCRPFGESFEELEYDLDLYRHAVRLPVLDMRGFESQDELVPGRDISLFSHDREL